MHSLRGGIDHRICHRDRNMLCAESGNIEVIEDCLGLVIVYG
ncbi:hypothetical protein [Mesorhizobium sp.]|nr:hypothetical protein [Mesorhizobium sp.]